MIASPHPIETHITSSLSLYGPAPWTECRPRFASKIGTYVSREVSLATEFPRTYVCRMYCDGQNGGEAKDSPKTPTTMGFFMAEQYSLRQSLRREFMSDFVAEWL